MRGADVASDRNLVRTIIKLKLKKRDRPLNPRTRYEVNKLQDRAIRNAFAAELRNRFAVLEAIDEQADINTKWHQFSKTYNATAEKVLGRKKRNNNSWIGTKAWFKE